jgi:hypothetical protein
MQAEARNLNGTKEERRHVLKSRMVVVLKVNRQLDQAVMGLSQKSRAHVNLNLNTIRFHASNRFSKRHACVLGVQ